MPFRAFCSFLPGPVTFEEIALEVGVSMPFRAFCSFLLTTALAKAQGEFDVSMPFRAFCSFLPLDSPGIWAGGESLNALPGILFFSTKEGAYDCINFP